MPLTPVDPATLQLKWTGVRDGGTPTFSFNGTSNSVELTGFATWQSVRDGTLAKYMLGISELDSESSTGLSRLVPYQHPDYVGMFATRLQIHGFKHTGSQDNHLQPVYGKAAFSVTLEQLPYDVLEDAEMGDTELERFVEIGPGRGAVEAITVPGGNLKYAVPPGYGEGYLPQGKPCPFNSSFYRSTESFSTFWHRLPYRALAEGSTLRKRLYGVNYNSQKPYIGTVNQLPVFGYPAGHLLLESCETIIEQSPTLIGEKEIKLVLNWKYSNIPWGYAPWITPDSSLGDTGWFLLGRDGSFYKPADQPDDWGVFNTRDHNLIWTLGDVGEEEPDEL